MEKGDRKDKYESGYVDVCGCVTKSERKEREGKCVRLSVLKNASSTFCAERADVSTANM